MSSSERGQISFRHARQGEYCRVLTRRASRCSDVVWFLRATNRACGAQKTVCTVAHLASHTSGLAYEILEPRDQTLDVNLTGHPTVIFRAG